MAAVADEQPTAALTGGQTTGDVPQAAGTTTGAGGAPAAGADDKQGFITQVDIEEEEAENRVAAYRVEDAEIPLKLACTELVLERSSAGSTTNPVFPLPRNLPLEKVKRNIANNLDFANNREIRTWFKIFSSPATNAVISDIFWYAICYYFKTGQHVVTERQLFDRISVNYVALFAGIPQARKDFFFGHFSDAIAQAVLYCLFLAYPKSRNHFSAQFREDLLIRVSYWFSGIKPQFVSISHWKLNLGGGDVLQSSMPGAEDASKTAAVLDLNPDHEEDMVIKTRPPRPIKTLRYSPLVHHFVKQQKFSSTNLIPKLKIALTDAEEHVEELSKKHSKLVDKAAAAKKLSQDLMNDYDVLHKEFLREENQMILKTKAAQQSLDARKKEVLRKAPHDFANYLVSLKLLQTE